MKLNPNDSKDEHQWRQASLALMLPTMMAAGPLAGYLLSLGIIAWFDVGPPWDLRIKIVMVVLGLLAGFRESFRIMQQLSADEPSNKRTPKK